MGEHSRDRCHRFDWRPHPSRPGAWTCTPTRPDGSAGGDVLTVLPPDGHSPQWLWMRQAPHADPRRGSRARGAGRRVDIARHRAERNYLFALGVS